MNSKVLEILMPIFISISTGVAALIGLYFTLGVTKLRTQISLMSKEADEKLASKILSDIEEIVKTSVVITNQTFVDAMKSKSLDGKLTSDETKEAFRITYDKVIELTGANLYAEARNIKPDINLWINSKIEYFVNQAK